MIDDHRPRRGIKVWVGGLVVVCLLVGGLLYWSRAGDDKPQPSQTVGQGKGGPAGQGRRAPVVTALASQGDVELYITGLGTVTSLGAVTVKSRVDGELSQVYFTEGQMVKEGDLLAQIDPRPFQVQLVQAEGQMAKDKALLDNAKADLERYRELLPQGAIAKQQFDTQQSLVRQYEGVVKSDQGAIENAKLQLTYSRITAPISGRVGLRLVDPGNMVRASDAGGLVVITQLSPIAVVFTIPEDSLQRVLPAVNAGQTLKVEAYDREQRRKLAEGTLLTVDNQIDQATGTVRLKAQFDNADRALFPNQFVNARLLAQTLRGVVSVPAPAVQRGPRGTFVYVITRERTAQMRSVELGETSEGRVVIRGGLAAGESVVVEGADRLRDGAPVELRDTNQG